MLSDSERIRTKVYGLEESRLSAISQVIICHRSEIGPITKF